MANLLKDTLKFACDKPSQNFGGAGIFVKHHFDMNELIDLKLRNDSINVENVWYELKNSKTNETIVVAVIYRHPVYTKNAYKIFLIELEKSFDIVSNENKKCIICGDINMDGLKIDNNENVNSFFNMILSNNFIPHITLPTHITDHSISIIDHILLKESDKFCNKITAGNIYNNITDHLPNVTLIYLHNCDNYRSTNRPIIRLYSEKNIIKFKNILSRSNWKVVLECLDVSKALSEFMDTYNKAFQEAFPLVRLSHREKDKKWFTAGMRKSKQTEQKLYKLKVRSPKQTNMAKYKTYKSVYSKCLKSAEQHYF